MAELSGHGLLEQGREFYEDNGALLDAMVSAAKVLSDHGIVTSANFLTNFARWYSQLGYTGVVELCTCFEGVRINGFDGEWKIPNATATYLGRYLERVLHDYPRFRIHNHSSKIDSALFDKS